MFGFLFGNKNVNNVSGAEAKEMIKKEKNLVIIDVRSEMEYRSGNIKGSKLIDISNPNFKKNIEKLNREKKYLLYCASGARSNRAASLMADLGFEKVYNVKGGIMALA